MCGGALRLQWETHLLFRDDVRYAIDKLKQVRTLLEALEKVGFPGSKRCVKREEIRVCVLARLRGIVMYAVQ